MASSSDQVVVSWSGIEVTLLVSIVQGLIFYCFFLFQRGRDIRKNRYDLYEPRQHTRTHRSPEPFPKYWLKAAWDVSQEETLRCVGLDSYMFLRFLRLGIRICTLGTVLSIALIPVYATGKETGNATIKFNLITLARVDQNEHRLWGTLACWWIFVLFILREFWNEWKLYAHNRYEFLARGDVDMDKEFRYAIRVEQIPREYRSDIALKQYFSRLFPNQVRQAIVYFNADNVQKLVDERLKLILKVEAIDAKLHAKPKMKRPMIRVGGSFGCCGGQKVDAILHYMSEIERLNNEIDTARKELRETEVTDTKSVEEAVPKDDSNDTGDTASSAGKVPEVKSSTGFITFTSLRSKQAAVQCELTGRRDSFVALPAPDPKAIIWDNITAPLPHQKVLQLQAAGLWTALAIFWTIPIGFVTSIANINSILKLAGAKTVDPTKLWYGLVSGVLPVVALAIFMAVLYMALVACATRFIRYKSKSEVDAYTLYWYQMFQFANLWNIVIVGSAFNQIKALTNDAGNVGEIVRIVASALPGASIFFANMIILGSFGSFGLELSMLPTHGVKLLMSLIQPESKRTQRMLDDMNKPPSIVWGQTIPPIVFIFLVSLVYMPIVPIMEVFGLVYFVGSYLVWKHQCLHVYAQEFEGGGTATWMQLFSFLMGCLYVGELIFIAFMGIKTAPIQSILSFVLLGITIFVHFLLCRNVIAPVKTLSLEKAAEVDIAEGELTLETKENEDLLYAVPALNPNMDERGPMPYRRDGPIDTTLPPESVQVVVPTDSELAPNPSMASTF